MKKILLAVIVISAVACSNPEDNASGANPLDSNETYRDGNTYNTMPGPASPDSVSGGMDRSHADSNKQATPQQ